MRFDETTADVGEASRLRSRWHRLFAAALKERAAVGVHVVLVEHLQRTPSRSEAIAARRAAHSFAAAGHARVEYAQVVGNGDPRRLVLVRANSSPATPEVLARAAAPTNGSSVLRTAQAMHLEAGRQLVESAVEIAKQSRHVRTEALTSAQSAALARSLAPALRDLANFRRRLLRASRRTADDTPKVDR